MSKFLKKALDKIEKIGNKMPHPVTIFVILLAFIICISAIGELLGWEVTFYDAKSKENVTKGVISFFSGKGIAEILSHAVSNFVNFAPLGVVLVAMLGVGIAEKTGFIDELIRSGVKKAPKSIIAYVVVFIGIMSNLASDAGYVVLVPLGAIVFLGFKRHPLAGMAAAFAGVSGGYSANLLFGPLDALLGGITTEGAAAGGLDVHISVMANWFFMIASTFVITIVGGLVTDKIVEPRLGNYKGLDTQNINVENKDNKREKLGLRYANISFFIYLLIVLWCILPIKAPIAGALLSPEISESGETIKYIDRLLGFTSPFHDSLIPLIALGFAIPGLAFGIGTKVIRNDKDVVHIMNDTMETMGAYIVLAFFAAQFIAVFNGTNLGIFISVKGAEFLKSLGLDNMPVLLLIVFVLLSAFINLFIGSASAKWGIMAPVFVPMLYQLGISPEVTQLAYRIGDSTTNIISPLMPYFAIIIAFASKYDVEGEEPTGIGTIMSMMIPYSIAFLISWVALMVFWYLTGLPIGL